MSPATRAMLGFAADWSLRKKVETLQRFLAEDFFHPSGIMYAMWHFGGGELRPFVAGDFDGMSVFKIKAGTTMEALQNHENSPYVAGAFLWSQCLRYQVTKDEEALRYAAKAFRSLDLNYKLAEVRGEAGFFCKPYNLEYTRETSPDQSVPIIQGFWEYRKICDEPTRARIDQMLPAMSDWWRTRNYRLVYFDHEGDWLNGDGLHQYGPFYLVLHTMAHRITGRQEYRDEADRILKMAIPFPWRHDVSREQMLKEGKCFWPERLHGYEYDPSRRKYLHLDWENYCAIWYASSSASWMIENEPSLKPTLQHAMGNYFRHQRQNVLEEDGLPFYWSQTDLETGKCYPLIRPRISTNVKDYVVDFDWNFCAYTSKLRWGDNAACLLDTALLAHHYAPGFSPGALTMARTMLAKLDGNRLRWMIDPDGQQLMPEDRWIGDTLSSQTPVFTVLTYWRARSWGIDVESGHADLPNPASGTGGRG